jgi:hypothetical protein
MKYYHDNNVFFDPQKSEDGQAAINYLVVKRDLLCRDVTCDKPLFFAKGLILLFEHL